MFYSSIGAEVLRIRRISSNEQNFLLSSKSVIERAVKQGAKSQQLLRGMKKVYGRQKVLKKFAINAKVFAIKLISDRLFT